MQPNALRDHAVRGGRTARILETALHFLKYRRDRAPSSAAPPANFGCSQRTYRDLGVVIDAQDRRAPRLAANLTRLDLTVKCPSQFGHPPLEVTPRKDLLDTITQCGPEHSHIDVGGSDESGV